jgi:hypothetical protein
MSLLNTQREGYDAIVNVEELISLKRMLRLQKRTAYRLVSFSLRRLLFLSFISTVFFIPWHLLRYLILLIQQLVPVIEC